MTSGAKLGSFIFGKGIMAEDTSSKNKTKGQDDKKSSKNSNRPIKRLAKKGTKKTKSTNPVTRYLKGAWAEIRRVTWPNRKEAIRLTVGVVIFSVATAGIISLIDYGFGEAFQRILLGS